MYPPRKTHGRRCSTECTTSCSGTDFPFWMAWRRAASTHAAGPRAETVLDGYAPTAAREVLSLLDEVGTLLS
jgi:hypothetical protein